MCTGIESTEKAEPELGWGGSGGPLAGPRGRGGGGLQREGRRPSCHCLSASLGVKEREGPRLRKNKGRNQRQNVKLIKMLFQSNSKRSCNPVTAAKAALRLFTVLNRLMARRAPCRAGLARSFSFVPSLSPPRFPVPFWPPVLSSEVHLPSRPASPHLLFIGGTLSH